MTLSTQEQILIEQRVTNEAKSTGAAYLIWLFLGGLGGHRFYLGRTGSAVLMLALFIIGWATLLAGVGAILLAVVGIWALIDAFLIPGMIQSHKNAVRQSLGMHAMVSGGQFGAPMLDTTKWSKADRQKFLVQQGQRQDPRE